MSGSAKQKRFEGNKNVESVSEVRTNKKINFKEKFLQLQIPSEKPRQKAPVVEKLMTRSCEILFECIKPYKDISVVPKKSRVFPKTGPLKRIFTTDIIYERKATRKVQFFEFSEDPMQSVSFRRTSVLNSMETPEAPDSEAMQKKTGNGNETESDVRQTSRTVSSEDFIKNVFSEPKISVI